MAERAFTEKIVDEVLGYIEQHDPETFQKINANSAMKDEIVSVIKETAQTERRQSEELKHHDGDVTKLNLPEESLSTIKDGLRMATFRVNIGDGVASLKFPDGTDFKTIHLDSDANMDAAHAAQVASIVIEAEILVLNILGIKVPIPASIIAKATAWVEKEYGSNSGFRLAVDLFVKAWKSAQDINGKAKAIFDLLVAMHKLGLFWKLTKILLSELSYSAWLKIAAKITALLVATFASDGIALIAKIALALGPAYEFNKKLDNLQTINTLKLAASAAKK